MVVRAVVFDFYGTLAPGRTAADQERARRSQAAALGVDATLLDREMTATVSERFTGAGGDVAGSLAWVTARFGAAPSPAQLAEAARIRLLDERRFGEPRADALPVLRSLRDRGLRIGVLSDCSAELPQHFGELPIAPYIDVAVFSFVTRHRKPAASNYLDCCAGLGVEPAECLYVGDGGSDELAGARRVGMRAVHLDVVAEAGGVVYGRHESWDGESVRSLTEVPALIDAQI